MVNNVVSYVGIVMMGIDISYDNICILTNETILSTIVIPTYETVICISIFQHPNHKYP